VTVGIPGYDRSSPRASDPRNAGAARATQEELASAAAITFGTVNRLESAKSAPAWATARALLDALDYSLADLAKAIDVTERPH